MNRHRFNLNYRCCNHRTTLNLIRAVRSWNIIDENRISIFSTNKTCIVEFSISTKIDNHRASLHRIQIIKKMQIFFSHRLNIILFLLTSSSDLCRIGKTYVFIYRFVCSELRNWPWLVNECKATNLSRAVIISTIPMEFTIS